MAALVYDHPVRPEGRGLGREQCHTPSAYSADMAPHLSYLRPPPRPSAATFWRRRVVVAALLVVSLMAAVHVLGRFGGGPLSLAEPLPTLASSSPGDVYIVQPGDTLWAIARSLQPEGDVRPLVQRLAAQLHGRSLSVGDRLVVD